MLPITSPDFILFKDDWDKWPTAIADVQTSNKTAVEYASLLKCMGVENHLWPLALINPALQGVDPHSPTLTVKQMVAIKFECLINPWYFFREVARAPASGGKGPGQLRFNRGNCYLWWCFFNHVNVILTQPRQTGKSLSVDELMTLLLEVYCRATKISLITKDEKLRVENTDRLKNILECLPIYMKNRTSRDRASSELIEVKKWQNTYTAYLCQKSEGAAHNLGRGGSTAIMQFDEPPFHSNFDITYGAVIGSMGAMIDNAKESNSLYGTIMTTTAAKKNTRSGKFFYQIVEKSAYWSEMFMDCKNIADLHKTIYHASRATSVDSDAEIGIGSASTYGCFSHIQLGYTDEWLRETLSRNQNPIAEDINRDFFNISTSGGERHPLDQHVLDNIIASIKEVQYTEVDPKYRYTIRWYIPKDRIEYEMNRRQVIIGCDMSEGMGKDYITLAFMDSESGEILAAATVKEANIIVFSFWFCLLLERFMKTVAIIERKNMGIALIDACCDYLPTKGIDPFKRLFSRIVQEKDETAIKRETFELIKTPLNRRPHDLHTKYKSLFGYTTAGSGVYSRDALYITTLSAAANRVASGVNDSMLIDQIAALVIKDGRIDHASGLHDDLVIAWLLCLWFIYNARNISHYGLDQNRILRVNLAQDHNADDDGQSAEQKELRIELDKYLKLLENEDDMASVLHYEQHVRYLESQIIVEDDDIYTVGALIAKASENRRKRRANVKGRLNYMDTPNDYSEHIRSTY